MKTRLTRISPPKLAALLACLGLFGSLLGIAFLLTTPMKDGVTVTLSGFSSMSFSNTIDYKMVMLHPILNTVFGLISGFVIAWLYNLWAKFSGGLIFELSETTFE
jgi:hypothetical protein